MPTASKQASTNISNYSPPQGDNLLEQFEQNHRSYIEFKAKGLDRPVPGALDRFGNPESIINKVLDDGLFRRHRRFLNNVDPSKGPIQRQVTRLERRRDLNPVTNKMEERLVIHLYWRAKDFLGNDIGESTIKEGVYNVPVVQSTLVNGRKQTAYSNWIAVYDIPFTSEAVDQALENQTNPPELVNYFVRVSRTTRDNTYSLEQFRDTTFEQAVEISKQGKGLNR